MSGERRLSYLCFILLALVKCSLQEECHGNNMFDKLYTTNNDDGTRNFVSDNMYATECKNFTGKATEDTYESSLRIMESNYTNTDLKSDFFKAYRRIYYLTMNENVLPNISSYIFKNLPNLSYLNLSLNAIKTLSQGAFSNLVELTTLDLSKNKISVIENSALAGTTSLVDMYLNNNELSDMSAVFDGCEKLNFVDLSNNKIETLIFANNCSELTYLYIHHNNIKKFPSDTFKNVSLVSLDISYNNLNSIGKDSFTYLTKLKALNLSGNALFESTDVPKDLFQFTPELITLNLSRTGMRNLPFFTLSRLHNLKVLDLSYNSLRTLPKYIFHNVSSLHGLYLNENPLFVDKDISVDFFEGITDLITLNLSSTGLKNIIPGTFSPFHQLEVLDLSQNKLETLSERLFHDAAALKKLYLNGNKLTYIHIDALPELTLINLNDNPWDCNTLFTVTKGLRGVTIVRGSTYDKSNLFGISCSGNWDDPGVQPGNFSGDPAQVAKDAKLAFQEVSRRQNALQNQTSTLLEQLKAQQNYTENLQKDVQKTLASNNDVLNSLSAGLIVLSCIILITIGTIALWVLIKFRLSKNSSVGPEEYANFSNL